MQLFAAYYTSKHSGRKLNWLHQHHGRVEVKLLYTDKKYDLSLMLVQFLVLSTFEKTAVGEVVGVDDIVNFTGLVNVEEVGRVVKSLVDVNLLKKKIELSGDGGGGVLKENDMIDRFVLNHGFTR